MSTEPKSEFFPGGGALLTPTSPRNVAEARVTDTGGITLNFVNTDIRDVAKAVLGDYLKLNYEITANVQGSVTLQTSRPLQRSQVLPVLEQVLRLNAMALVHSNGIYKVVPLSDAHNLSGPVTAQHGGALSGYGIEIVPVHYITAAEMEKLLQPLAPTQAIVHVDTMRNVLIIEGSEEERETLRDDIALFDADWLSGMSYALFSPNYTDAEELTKELNQILGGANSPIAGVVRLVPIARLNTVLAISPQEKYLEQLEVWIKRLDHPGQGSDRKVFVYRVQNGRARDLAATLSAALLGNGHDTHTQQTSGGPQSPSISGANTSDLSFGAPGNNAPAPPPAAPPTASNLSTGLESSGGPSGSKMIGGSITADETNNALVIVATPQEYSTIAAALRELDTPPLQVFLEAAIAEITLNNNLQYGVQYVFNHGQNQVVLSQGSSSTIGQIFPGFSYAFTGANINVILNALSTITHVEVVSAPRLLVLNNQTADLQVGDRIPIETQQAVGVETQSGSIVNTIQYQDTGVILKATPRVNHGGLVMLDITQEVSEVTTTVSSNIDSPTIEERKINSSIAVQDGETIALGGLISDSRNRTRSGIPYLSQIPGIGPLLFGDETNTKSRTELMVLITPHVIENLETARAVTTALRHELPNVQTVFERAHTYGH